MSFNGVDWTEILRFNSDGGSADFHPDAQSEHVLLDLGNPADTGSVYFRFGLTNAGNDWWWAVDNIVVSGVTSEAAIPEPSTLTLAALGLFVLAIGGRGRKGN